MRIVVSCGSIYNQIEHQIIITDAMNYSLVMRGNPRYPEKGQKAYASAQYHKVLSFDELISFIQQHGSSYRAGDYRAIVSNLAEAMAEKMKEGYKIDLAELGKFYPTLDCEGADSMQEFDPDKHIKGIRVNWEASKSFKQLREQATFHEVLNRRLSKRLLKAEIANQREVKIH